MSNGNKSLDNFEKVYDLGKKPIQNSLKSIDVFDNPTRNVKGLSKLKEKLSLKVLIPEDNVKI